MATREERIHSALAKHNYTQIKKVGEGSFGAAILVQHASEREKDTKAVVKMIDISRASRQEKEDAVKESQVLSSLKHPYIVRYRESFHEDGWLCIVMDYCEGGDLADRLKKARQQGKVFPQDQVLRWFTQAVLALKYIHDMHILHRDLKSGNFFLSRSGNIKMGDFGIAKVLECTAACAQTQIGTPYYLSPEICQGKPYAWSSDIWSMGCILYEMCARKVPFDAPDLKTLIQKITKGPPPEVPADYTLPLRNLCKDLLERDPSRRPPAAEILKRPVVQEMVRRMLDEVKGEEEPSRDEKAGGSAPSRGPHQRENCHSAAEKNAPRVGGKYGGFAGSYERNSLVEYYSETHGEWLPATVTNSDEQGRIMLNVKPGVYLSLEVQGAKVRPRQQPGAPGGSPGPPGDRLAAAQGGVQSMPAPRPSPHPPSADPAALGEFHPSSPSARPRPPLAKFSAPAACGGGHAMQRQGSAHRCAPPCAERERADPLLLPRERLGQRGPSPRRDSPGMLVRVPSQGPSSVRQRTPGRQPQVSGRGNAAGLPSVVSSRGGAIHT